jgi:hypothetical protein
MEILVENPILNQFLLDHIKIFNWFEEHTPFIVLINIKYQTLFIDIELDEYLITQLTYNKKGWKYKTQIELQDISTTYDIFLDLYNLYKASLLLQPKKRKRKQKSQ